MLVLLNSTMYRTLLTDLTNLLTYPQVVLPTGMKKIYNYIIIVGEKSSPLDSNLQIIITRVTCM